MGRSASDTGHGETNYDVRAMSAAVAATFGGSLHQNGLTLHNILVIKLQRRREALNLLDRALRRTVRTEGLKVARDILGGRHT